MKKRGNLLPYRACKPGCIITLCFTLLLAGCGNMPPSAPDDRAASQVPSTAAPSGNGGPEAVPAGDMPSAPESSSAATSRAKIGLEQAEAAALAHAGLEPSDVTFTKGKLEHDNGIAQYDIEFVTSTTEYDYEIDALDGSVLGYSQESLVSGADASQTPAPAAGLISADDAKAAALKHAGLDLSEVTFTKSKLDYDDGVAEYEIEFYTASAEYEYEIQAADGSVLSFSRDIVAPEAGSTNPQNVISVEEAKTAALNYASMDASQVVFTDIELDYDDGVPEYEIEFKVGRTEYSFTIDAASGRVLEMETDQD